MLADGDPAEASDPSDSPIRSTVSRLYGLIGRDATANIAGGSGRRRADSDRRARGSPPEDGQAETSEPPQQEAGSLDGAQGGFSFDQFTVVDESSPAELGTDLRYKADVIRELFGAVDNVCLRGPTGGPFDYQLCSHFVDGSSHGGKRILVTTDQSALDRLQTLEGYGAGPFDEVTVIALGDRASGAGLEADDGSTQHGASVAVKRVPDQRDLVRLGLLINTELDVPEEGEPPTICFHHLDNLLARAELEQVFRFLHILQGRVAQAGARAHYHLDPTYVSDSELSILDQLFDVTISFDADGNVSVGA